MRILVSGGGTAGHVSPILATVDALRKLEPKAEFLYVGAGQGIEAKLVRSAGLPFASISAGKYRRFHGLELKHKIANLSSVWLNFTDLFRVLRGVWQSLKILRRFEPNVVFVKGGFVGLPVGIAARILGYPLIIHESDMLPGLTNRILSRWAEKIAVGFPVEKYRWEKDKLTYTGSPIRQVVKGGHRLTGLKHFKLSADLPVVLVIGGSSGARTINEVVIESLDNLLKVTQVIHVAGERDIERVRFSTRHLPPELSKRYRLEAFLADDIGLALETADVVVSRAGANSLAELAILKKPTILIPNPNLVGGHQTLNAQVLARAGAVRVITEAKLTPTLLTAEVRGLAENEEAREDLALKIGEFAVPDADERLAKAILSIARPDQEPKGGEDA